MNEKLARRSLIGRYYVAQTTFLAISLMFLLIELRRYFTRDEPKSTNIIYADQQIVLKSDGMKYRLTSVIDHEGKSISGGHYKSFIFDGTAWTKASM